ncbi:MAG TPA: ABC transporter ATP-binding protein [Verrucomicrobiae bacterium]|nr:ABC transporter ATP-binding protein [Verrucomicrobiae bacterium]
MARVIIDHLTKVFERPGREPVQALSDLNLSIADGELLVLTGPSGCGKTTTLRLLAGLEEPTSGLISIDERKVNGLSARQRDVAMVFQAPALYPHMSVQENLAFGLRLRRHKTQDIQRRVREAAELLDLADCLERDPASLSGGQRQRVALGRALVRAPKVLLLDEPLSNLDAHMRAQLRLEISRLHARLRVTVIYVTHDQTEAMALGDRLAVLHQGLLQQLDTPIAVYRKPVNLFVARFLGLPPMNLLHGHVVRTAHALWFKPDSISSAAGLQVLRLRLGGEPPTILEFPETKPLVLGVRPEDVAIGASIPQKGLADATVATVEAVEVTGPDAFVRLQLDGICLTARVLAGQHHEPGEKIPIALAAQRAHFFDPVTGVRI